MNSVLINFQIFPSLISEKATLLTHYKIHVAALHVDCSLGTLSFKNQCVKCCLLWSQNTNKVLLTFQTNSEVIIKCNMHERSSFYTRLQKFASCTHTIVNLFDNLYN